MVWISRIHADSCRTSPFHRLTCDNRSPRRSRDRGRPHPEPAMRSPCSLGRVPTAVTTSSASCASTCPRSWRSCTRSSTSAIQTRFGVTSTPAPRGGSVRSRGSRAPCTVPCVSGARPRPCGPVGSGARVPEDGWRHRRAWRRRNVPQYRGFKPTPTSQITEAEVFHGRGRHDMLHEGYGTVRRQVDVDQMRV